MYTYTYVHTGIGCAGDWCVEGSVEGAYVSGLELAARVGQFRHVYMYVCVYVWRVLCEWP